MAVFGLLLYVSVLLLNAVAILSEDRFLARLGWTAYENQGFGANEETLKNRIVKLINAIRTVMRPSLIAFNIVIIVYEIVLG